MEKLNFQQILCNKQALRILSFLSKKLRNLYLRLRFLIQRRPRPRIIIRRLKKFNSKWKSRRAKESCDKASRIHLNGLLHDSVCTCIKPIRIATFNAALFAVSPVVPNRQLYGGSVYEHTDYQIKPPNTPPKSILKNSPLHSHPSLTSSEQNNKISKSKLRVSIDLPENEISLSQSKLRNNVPVRSPLCFPLAAGSGDDNYLSSGTRTIWDVLKEVDADILALQDVKSDEERGMQPLSDLADNLGMTFVFAGSWAPEYGNAILSKWPIKRWRVQKILNDQDIRNVLKATIDVPYIGQVNVYCTQLDYLNEDWRMKQINAIIDSSEGPHILAGGLNSLERSDYSLGRWTNIVKYFEDIGKPKPKDEVLKFLKGRGYIDAKYYAGDCEPAVMIAKGQHVQGTCKYGTRVDYILSSPNLPYKFVPGSYSVISSKGTSDHHVVKVDIIKGDRSLQENLIEACRGSKKIIVRTIYLYTDFNVADAFKQGHQRVKQFMGKLSWHWTTG